MQEVDLRTSPHLHHPPTSALPVAPLSDEDASDTVRGFEVQIPAGEVQRLRDKAWQQGQRRVRGGTVELSW